MTALTTSLIPTVIDALVAQATAALPAITVRDGADTASQERLELQIGADVEGGDHPWEQRWAGLGHINRDETFAIPCLLFARSGDKAFKPLRDEAYAQFALLETSLRTTPNLGIATNSIRAEITPALFSQYRTSKGPVARLHFYVNLEGRI